MKSAVLLQNKCGESTPPSTRGFRASGRVLAVQGTLISAELPCAAIGDLCRVQVADRVIPAQVVGFNGSTVTLAPFELLHGVGPGARVESEGQRLRVTINDDAFGGTVNYRGAPLSNQVLDHRSFSLPIHAAPPSPLTRAPIATVLETGIRSIDALATIGYGQRLGLFASAGVGKSTLLAQLSRCSNVDRVVIALIGERGREVGEFVDLVHRGDDRKRTIIVASTSDESPIRRYAAALSATTIAEHYRGRGEHVLLLIDSLTRVARAIRDIGLAAGEIPVRQGYPASVFSELPLLVERPGSVSCGSITALYTVLTNAEDDIDPLADEVKSLLDGHLVLSDQVALAGVRPALDFTRSISRLFTTLNDAAHQRSAGRIRQLLNRIKKDRDLVLLGGKPDPELAVALSHQESLQRFLHQSFDERASLSESRNKTESLARALDAALENYSPDSNG